MIAPGPLAQVCVILTARCNLRCGYCYQSVRPRRGRMSWQTLRASIDLLLSSPCRDVELAFLGGEPLLEFDLLRRGVVYAREHVSPRQSLRTSVQTNGMLLTDEVIGFLADAGADTQLSFDGVRAAQDDRQKGTFDRLDRLLDRLRERWPQFFRRNVTIAATLTPGNVPHLADSFDYFLDKDVRRIITSPVITPTPEWRLQDIEELDRQFSRIVRSSLRQVERAGRHPLALPGGTRRAAGDSGIMMCGILPNDSLVVDVGGWVHACAAFAASTVRPTNALMADCARTTRISRLTDAGFAARLRAFPDAVARNAAFTRKERKRSGYRGCSTCPHLEVCLVCPAAIAHDGEDPDRIPDFCCAFNSVSLGRAAALPAARSPRDRIRSGPARRLPVESGRTRSAGRPPSQRQARDA